VEKTSNVKSPAAEINGEEVYAIPDDFRCPISLDLEQTVSKSVCWKAVSGHVGAAR